jgi:hypothetical protein
MNELINSFNYSNDEIISNSKIDSILVSELRLETVKTTKTQEEKELELIIYNIQSLFEEKTKKISQIELYNLAIYYKDNYTQSNYLLYDTRKTIEQKEDYLKKMNHINYTYNQMRYIKDDKLKKFRNFLNNKKIIFIISEKFLKSENKRGKVTPCDIINLLFDINSNLTIYILNNILDEKGTPKIFIKLISFLGNNTSLSLPYILFSYRHVTSFYIDGYIFINFSNNKIFSFESLINELKTNKGVLSFENNFLESMNINTIVNIDNNSKSEYKIKEENYKNKNCFIYTLPETEKKEEKDILRHSLKNFKLKTNIKLVKKDKYDITEKEKDAIKETIKDFTMKIFKSEDIGKNQKLKMSFQNVINTPFGRQFFVSILSKNLTNIILLKEKSFNLLGALIYNSLLFVLNIKETEQILEEIVILVKSTKYFGEETNGKTITLWEVYNSRIQGYSKVNQNNFWVQWYKMEHKNQNDKKADDIMYYLGKIMIDLKLDKSFIKNVIKGLGEKEFGKQSSESKIISDTIVENIKLARYRSKEFEN